MRFAFFGTDEFSVTTLNKLKEAGYLPDLIITSPDRPKGRKLIMTPPEAKVWSEENNVKYIQPEKLSPELLEGKWDLFVVASYGKIIPTEIINLPTHKTLNVHPSLLPKLRGASPIQSAILEEQETGVTIMRIGEKMDHGPIVDQIHVLSWDTPDTPDAPELEKTLAEEGGKLLASVIPEWIGGNITEQEQDHQNATYTKKLKKEDGLLNPSDPIGNFKKIQAFKKWPRAYFFAGDKRVIVTEAGLNNKELKIQKVIPEGKKEITFEEFKSTTLGSESVF